MKFTLDAGGAQAAGQGIGNIFKAYALGDQYRQQGEMEAMTSAARMGQAQAAARKFSADAALDEHKLKLQSNPLETALLELNLPTALAPAFRTKLETGSFGPSYDTPADGVGPVMPAPADNDTVAKLGRSMALMQRMYGTGSNVEQMAKAGSEIQTQGIRDKAVAAVGDLDMMNRLNALAKEGTTYKPFAAVGNTGGAINQATGQGIVSDAVLRKLFGDKNASEVMENKAQANSANASAGKYTAEADIERQKADRLRTTGALPGTGAEGSEGALSSTILNTLKVPALDAKGRPVRNPITGELETVVDQDAQKSFYQWADQNKRKPTATAFSQWEAQGRPGANKNPPPAAAQPTIVQAPPAQQRKPNTVYQTPKGPMKWTGTGWLPAN